MWSQAGIVLGCFPNLYYIVQKKGILAEIKKC